MTRITVKLDDKHFEALHRSALLDYRDPRDQAAWLILRGLEAAGLLPVEESAERLEPPERLPTHEPVPA